jgi:hypothetical protein
MTFLPCIFEGCDGQVDQDQPPPEWAANKPDFQWPPKACSDCIAWRKKHQTARVVECRNCGQDVVVSAEEQVGLRKFDGVAAEDIDAFDMCPRCLRASPEERAERNAVAQRDAQRKKAAQRTHDRLRQFKRQELIEQALQEQQRYYEKWHRRLHDAKPHAAPALTDNELGELLASWQEPVARQERIAQGPRFLQRLGDELHATGAIPKDAAVRYESLKSRLSGASNRERQILLGLFQNEALDQTALVRGLGNPNLDVSLAGALPEAMAKLLTKHPEVTALFMRQQSYWGKHGKGAPPAWITSLAGAESKANGTAYEMVGMAALTMNNPSSLRIYGTDRIDYCGKLDKGHHSGTGTVEADFIVSRQQEWGVDKKIGIDFKHTGREEYSSKKSELERQLSGIVNAILDGQVQEFHFVTNARLSNAFHEAVAAANEEIWAVEQGHDATLAEDVGDHLTSVEAAALHEAKQLDELPIQIHEYVTGGA